MTGRGRLLVGAGVVVGLVLGGVAAITLVDAGNPTVIEVPTSTPDPTASATDQGGTTVEGAGAGAFPTVRSEDLDGQEVALPDGFPGVVTAVLVSFERGHQDAIDEWIAALAPREAQDDRLDHVQLVVTADEGPVVRSTVLFFMGQAIDEPAARARTIPLFTDPAGFASLVGVSGIEDMAVLLVDAAGQIAWTGTGTHSMDLEAALLAELEAA